MRSVRIKQILWLSILFYITNQLEIVVSLRHCGKFDIENTTQQRISGIGKGLEFESELEQLFDGFQEKNFIKMNRALKMLQNMKIDESAGLANDLVRTIPDRINAQGYPAEVHSVETNDGYHIKLYRIPFSPKSPETNKTRRAVFLMHGFMEVSNCFIALGAKHSIAYLLADAGFDVWLGNARGTDPSRAHTSFDPSGKGQKDFWSYTWHEIGLYDISASIDHILSITNQKKIDYLGHSQGTTALMVLLSMRPEYNDKINEANFLAPAAYLKNIRNPFFKVISDFYKPLKAAVATLRIHKINFNHYILIKIAEFACKKADITTSLKCKFIMSILYSDQINCTSLPDILEFTPSGSSTKQGLHYLQLIRSGEFRQFDYESPRLNRNAYGQSTPPFYNLTQITAPINIFLSKDDSTTTYENVMKLQFQLPNVKQSYIIPISNFEHVDFLYSRNVREVLNEKIVESIKNAN